MRFRCVGRPQMVRKTRHSSPRGGGSCGFCGQPRHACPMSAPPGRGTRTVRIECGWFRTAPSIRDSRCGRLRPRSSGVRGVSPRGGTLAPSPGQTLHDGGAVTWVVGMVRWPVSRSPRITSTTHGEVRSSLRPHHVPRTAPSPTPSPLGIHAVVSPSLDPSVVKAGPEGREVEVAVLVDVVQDAVGAVAQVAPDAAALRPFAAGSGCVAVRLGET